MRFGCQDNLITGFMHQLNGIMVHLIAEITFFLNNRVLVGRMVRINN